MCSFRPGARPRQGFSIVEVLCVLVLIALVAVPVLGLGTVDHRAAAKRLERIERLAELRALADDLATRPASELRAAAAGAALPPREDGTVPRVRVELDEDVLGAAGLHRLTVALEPVPGRAPLAVMRLVEDR